MNKKKKLSNRVMAGCAMLSALATVLMYLEFPIPMLLPSFLKFDFSDLPALIGAYAYGPLAGVIIEFIKNILHCAVSQSATVGELSNFILGASFAYIAGFVYKRNKSRKSAMLGGIIAAVVVGLLSIVTNYFIVYPFYYKAYMPEEVVLSMYQAIIPSMKSVLMSLFVFNLPFTIVKLVICVAIAMPVYKPIRRVLKNDSDSLCSVRDETVNERQ